MRILDELNDKSINKVTLYLTKSEARELLDGIEQLIVKEDNNHVHINDEDFKKEVTVCIYDLNRLKGLNGRSVKIIMKDE
jgi:hypothetical protein